MTQPRGISILGSTGVNTLDVIRHSGGRDAFEVTAVTGSANTTLMAKQARAVNAKIADITMAAIVGMAGLEPTLAAAKNGGTIALANKECLVSAGTLFLDAIHQSGGKLLPVDSKHNAIFQMPGNEDKKALERVILTASGGPFRNWTLEQMKAVTVETARAHPNWSMGLKISIDSASMFNKALEMIEAKHLFGLNPEQLKAFIAGKIPFLAMAEIVERVVSKCRPPNIMILLTSIKTIKMRAS